MVNKTDKNAQAASWNGDCLSTEPHNPDTERLVLGTLMNASGSLDDLAPLLEEDTFWDGFHRTIFRAVKQLDSQGKAYDWKSVWDVLERRGLVERARDLSRFMEIASCQSFTPAQPAAHLADLLAFRRIRQAGQWLLGNTRSAEDPADVVEHARRLLDGVQPAQDAAVPLSEALAEVSAAINANLSGEAPGCSPTGFTGLDRLRLLGGGNLTVIAADSSQGKTALALTLAANAARAGHPVAYYTLEMTPAQLATRLLSGQSGIGGLRLATCPLSDGELQAADRAIARLSPLPLYMDGNRTSRLDGILSGIRRMKKRHGIRGAVVDYLQILSVNDAGRANEEQRMAIAARLLKNLALELGIWIIALSQLSRDRDTTVPTAARLRGSGQIYEAADFVLLVYRPEHYGPLARYPEPHAGVDPRGTALLRLAKGRNTGLADLIAGFDAKTTTFRELATVPSLKPGEGGGEEEKPF